MTYLYLVESDVDLTAAALEAELDAELESILLSARAQREATLEEEAA